MMTLAYSFNIQGGWVHACPSCHTKYAERWKNNGYEAEAELTGLNGDTIACYICGEEIK